VINRLVIENLKHRRLRTGLSALSIGFQVTMILAVVGLSRGMLQDSQARARGAGADIFVKPPGASAISLAGASMPEKMISAFFLNQPHVKRAAGTLVHPIGGISTITGVRIDDFTAMSGKFRFVEGGPFQGKLDVIVDEYYAEQNKKHVGDTIRLIENDWRISGIAEAGKLARIIVPLDTLQDLTGNTGKVSQVLLKLDDPKSTPSVIASLKGNPGLDGYSIYSVEEFVSLFSVDNVPGLKAFIYVIIGLSIVIGFLVVWLTMYTTVLERTREIGILKALGASPVDIINILLRETLVLALVGWASGIALSYAANAAINGLVHASLQSVIVYDWWLRVMAIAVFASLLGAIWPGLRAARQDAIEALAYE
jgi:putative ABC transport system permease protein